MDLTCYLAFPQQADEAAFDAMMRNWRACGGRLHPGLLRAYQGEAVDAPENITRGLFYRGAE